MPKKSGLKLIQDIKQDSQQLKVPIIILSATPGDVSEVLNKYSNIKALQKPIEAKAIVGLAKAIINPPKKKDEEPKKPNRVTVAPGDLLLKEGDEGSTLYWLAAGKMEVFMTKESGEEVILGEVNQGELVGEMSFLNDKKRVASVRAVEESQLLEIPVEKFSDVLDAQPAWFQSLVRTLSTRLISTSKKLSV